MVKQGKPGLLVIVVRVVVVVVVGDAKHKRRWFLLEDGLSVALLLSLAQRIVCDANTIITKIWKIDAGSSYVIWHAVIKKRDPSFGHISRLCHTRSRAISHDKRRRKIPVP